MKIYGVSANLFDKNNTSTADGYKANYYVAENGTETSNIGYDISIYIPVKASTAYTLSFSADLSVFAPSIALYDNSKTFISGTKFNGEHEITVTTTAATAYIRLSIRKTYVDTYMFNEGSSAIPYEPYGKSWLDRNLISIYTSGSWTAATEKIYSGGSWS